MILLSFLLLAVSISFLNASLTSSQKEEIVRAHNYFRGKVDPIATDMQKLEWDEELAYIAQFWAANCHYGYNEYRSQQSSEFNYVGEIQIYSTNRYVNYTFLVLRWFSLRRRYNYYKTSCRNKDGSRSLDGEDCSPYRQLVWAESYAVGCGAMRCENLYNRNGTSTQDALYLVCNYGPGGTYEGQKPYKTGSSVCSNCPSTTSYCVNKLCSKSSAGPIHSYELYFIQLIFLLLILD